MIIQLFVAFLIVGILCILFYVPTVFSRSIMLMQYDKLPLKEQLISFIPAVNVVWAEHIYTGKMSVNMLADIAFVIAWIGRLTARATMRGTIFSTVSTIVLLLSFVALWFANAFLVFIILHDSEVKTTFRCVMYAIFFTLGQHYISVYMQAEIRALEKRRETFG